VVWSNSFVAMGFLLGGDRAPQRLDWIDLTALRFSIAGSVAGLFCVGRRWRESRAIVARFPVRLALCAVLAVPTYNFALYYAREHGVSPPIASLTTALVPLFVMLLSAAFLAEKLTGRRTLGLAIACAGMLVIATSHGELDPRYPWMIALATVAPLSWSIYSVASKPVAARASPLSWSYLSLALGALFVVPVLPRAWPKLVALDGPGWFALLYLAIPCAVIGNAVWTWLLRHMPASALGFTVFLNPPLTTLSKSILAAALPATFVFSVVLREWVGAGVVLVGLAVGLSGYRARRPPH
jgi:O-acetylserine/cysteine efflux transporter